MQQPQQQQQFVPYFNQPRVQMPPVQQQAPMVYAEQQPQTNVAPQTLIYPQIHPQTVPQQPQSWCGRQGGCRWAQCCKRFNLQKGFKIAAIAPVVTFFASFILSLFNGRYHGPVAILYIMPIIMALVAAIVGIVGLKKQNITFLGVFLGMVGFSLLAGFYNFTPALLLAFTSFTSFLIACLEVFAVTAKVGSIVMAVKLIKKIQNQESLELPAYQEQTSSVQEIAAAVPQQITVPQVIPQQQQMVVPQVIPQQPQVIVPQQQQQQQIQLPPVPQKNFEHDLNLLREMGFSNVELNTRLLQKHNGNLAGVLQELVSN